MTMPSIRTSTPTRWSTPSRTARRCLWMAGQFPGTTTNSPAISTARRVWRSFPTAGHTPAKCRIYKGQNIDQANLLWAYPQPEKNPYQLEWDDFLDAIRNDKPYNELERGVMASAVTSMGRMAAHTGQMWTLKDFLDPDVNDHEFAPDIENLTLESESPLKADANGRYPIPLPGSTRPASTKHQVLNHRARAGSAL